MVHATEARINAEFSDHGWHPSKTLDKFDLSNLNEDLAQYSRGSMTVDFGYYETSSPHDGEFIIYIIANEDWDNFLLKICLKQPKHALGVLVQIPGLIDNGWREIFKKEI